MKQAVPAKYHLTAGERKHNIKEDDLIYLIAASAFI
jgi:hypothetical protein